MTDKDLDGMPWAGILKVTAQVAVAVGVGVGAILTGLTAAGRRQERREKEESERFRWTDANRWEK